MVKILTALLLLVALAFGSSERYAVYYDSPKDDYKSYTDTSFVSGDSPASLNVFTDLGRNTYNGEITNDGPGLIDVYLSSDGTTFGDSLALNSGEILDITTHRINEIIISYNSEDSAYRARFW